jgi:hypothetical protein
VVARALVGAGSTKSEVTMGVVAMSLIDFEHERLTM